MVIKAYVANIKNCPAEEHLRETRKKNKQLFSCKLCLMTKSIIVEYLHNNKGEGLGLLFLQGRKKKENKIELSILH